jgi:hypothetical protein
LKRKAAKLGLEVIPAWLLFLRNWQLTINNWQLPLPPPFVPFPIRCSTIVLFSCIPTPNSCIKHTESARQ